jgi:dolichol-phosphate mannosyltransferase
MRCDEDKDGGQMTLISFIIPTYNEKKNIPIITKQLFDVAKKANLELELVIVDDNSPDGTGKLIDELAKTYRIVPVHRAGKLGLGSAVTMGFKHAHGDILGVIDADLSHPPDILPRLVKPLIEGKVDMCVGSRYIKGGGVEVWPWHRRLISLVATMPTRPLTRVKDPMSGLFAFKSGVIKGAKLNVKGYKIGMEILVKGKIKRVREVPFVFRNRRLGKSKLGMSEYWDYMYNLLKLYFYLLRNGRG